MNFKNALKNNKGWKYLYKNTTFFTPEITFSCLVNKKKKKQENQVGKYQQSKTFKINSADPGAKGWQQKGKAKKPPSYTAPQSTPCMLHSFENAYLKPVLLKEDCGLAWKYLHLELH